MITPTSTTPISLAPRYGFLALASCLVTIAASIFAVADFHPAHFFVAIPTLQFTYLLDFICYGTSSLLILASIPAFGAVRWTGSRPLLITCYFLAALHLLSTLLEYAIKYGYFARDPFPGHTPLVQIAEVNFLLDRTLRPVLILVAFFFLRHFQNTAISILVYTILAPGVALYLFVAAFVSVRVSTRQSASFDFGRTLTSVCTAYDLLHALFWLTLTILATVLAQKSRPT